MKKLISILLTSALLLSLTACGWESAKRAALPTGNATIDRTLTVDYADIEDNYNRAVLLTDDKLIFTSYDSGSSFGAQQRPYVYYLQTGDIKPLVDFDLGDFCICAMMDHIMYFTCDTFTDYIMDEEGYNRGYCLFRYDLKNGDCEKICETPNCFTGIQSVTVGDSLLYLVSTTTQQELEATATDPYYGPFTFSLYQIKNGESTLLDDTLVGQFAMLLKTENGALLYTNPDENFSHVSAGRLIDGDGNMTPSDIPFDYNSYFYREEPKQLDGKLFSGTFGRYLVLEDPIPDNLEHATQYNRIYYLYDTQTEVKTSLVTTTDWFYLG